MITFRLVSGNFTLTDNIPSELCSHVNGVGWWGKTKTELGTGVSVGSDWCWMVLAGVGWWETELGTGVSVGLDWCWLVGDRIGDRSQRWVGLVLAGGRQNWGQESALGRTGAGWCWMVGDRIGDRSQRWVGLVLAGGANLGNHAGYFRLEF